MLERLLAAPMRAGRVVWLGLRPARRAAVVPVGTIVLDERQGLAGDHYAGRSGARQVTLIAAEAIEAIAGHLGVDAVAPEALRRNVVVRGLNLHALRGAVLSLGSARVEVTGACHPCSRMEEALGEGGYNAVRGMGGATARVVRSGTVRLGDNVARLG